LTACFSFNLEKFISEGYGKNLYLSHTYFTFASGIEKQKQVLKSLLVFTLIKKLKKRGYYHNPLLITLVNSINTVDSELLLFFKKIEEMVTNNISYQIFDNAKNEFKRELLKNKIYIILGQEELKSYLTKLVLKIC